MMTLTDFRAAAERIAGITVRTPLVPFPVGGDGIGTGLWLKPENQQPIGAFKLRGAYNRLAQLTSEQRQAGVIAYSSGNHAQGVAYAARALGLRAVIVMPGNAPAIKMRGTAALGAEIITVGGSSEERRELAESLAQQQGYVLVPPYNDERILAGQGTVGLEIMEQMPEVELILAPVGGGGLLGGVAAAAKFAAAELGRSVRVVGVEPELAADAQASFRSGGVVKISGEDTARTIADGLRTQSLGDLTYPYIRDYVDDIITVSEAEIRESVRRMAGHPGIQAEPSGAVAAAGYLFHRAELPATTHTVAVISGGNIEPEVLAAIQAEGAAAQ